MLQKEKDMPDTRKTYKTGTMIPGFKPGQPPYVVGPDKTVSGCWVHITIDSYDPLGKWDRKVRSFHMSFKDFAPQPVGKWAFNSMLDRYDFKGWANFERIGVVNRADFLQKVNVFVNSYRATFGSSGFGPAV